MSLVDENVRAYLTSVAESMFGGGHLTHSDRARAWALAPFSVTSEILRRRAFPGLPGHVQSLALAECPAAMLQDVEKLTPKEKSVREDRDCSGFNDGMQAAMRYSNEDMRLQFSYPAIQEESLLSAQEKAPPISPLA